MARHPATPGRTSVSEIAREVIENMPFGILVTASNGSVLSVNQAAKKLLSEADGKWPQNDVSCCDLLGCRRADGLAEHCISALASSQTIPCPRFGSTCRPRIPPWLSG